MVAVEGLTHLVRYANPAFHQLLGIEDQHLLGRRFKNAVPEGLANTCAAMLGRVFATGTSEALIEQEHGPDVWAKGIVAAKGPTHWSYLAWAILGPDHTPAGVMIQVTDATEAARFRRVAAAVNEALLVSGVRQHEMMEKAAVLSLLVSQSEQRLRTMADAMPQLASMASADGTVQWYNKRWYEYTGATPVQLHGSGWQSVMDPQVLPAVLENWMASVATGRPFEMIFPLRGKDGTFRAFLSRAEALKDADGNVTQWFGTTTDIDQVQRATEAMRQSEERFRALVTASSDVVYRMSADWSISHPFDGRNFIHDTNAPTRDWLTRHIHPDDQPMVMAAVQQAIRGKGVYELEHRVRLVNGTWGWTFSRAVPLLDAAGEITEWFGAASNVTDRKQAEEALRASEDRYRTLFNSIDDGFCVIEKSNEAGEPSDFRYIEANPAVEAQSGIAGVVGKTMRQVFPTIGEEWCETFDNVLATGEPIRFEGGLVTDGRVLELYAFRVEDGTNRRVAVIFKDITARKSAEQELLRHRENLERAVEQRTAELSESVAKLVASERLAALGTLAAGLGHDIANITMPIRARLDVLANTLDSQEGKGDIDAVMRGIEHLNNVSAGMRLLALDPERAGASAPVADLAQWCSQTTALFRSAVARHITVECSMPSGVGVPIAAHRLAQAIYNLVQNAGEAMAGQKAGRIGVSGEVAEQAGRARVVLLRVTDDGPGMPPEVLAHCFEPYFSTKGRTISTGMGLGMVKGIVEAAGGRVLLESAPGKGTTFTLSIPVAPAADQGTPSPARLHTAAVSIRHPRTASLACLFLEQLDVSPRRMPSDIVPGTAIWIVDDPDPAQVAAYLDAHIHRRVVVLGPPAPHVGAGPDHASEGGDSRVVRLPAVPTPHDLRQALTAAGRAARSRMGEG